MTILAAITAALEAFAQAAKAFPLWLAWRQSEHIETLTDKLIEYESRSLANERPALDRMRVKLANARKQHEAVLAVITPPQGGVKG